ncbi:phosphoenolpyruvate synthase, partial [Haloferax sp. Atlit-6N]
GDDKRFYILQSRPETTWNEDDEASANATSTSSSSTAERILDRL